MSLFMQRTPEPTFSKECVTPNDIATDDWHTAGSALNAVEMAVKEIERETMVLRGLGLIAPFVEGEPIGAYKKTKRTKVTAAEVRRYHKLQSEGARKELIALRIKNDTDMALILGRI